MHKTIKKSEEIGDKIEPSATEVDCATTDATVESTTVWDPKPESSEFEPVVA